MVPCALPPICPPGQQPSKPTSGDEDELLQLKDLLQTQQDRLSGHSRLTSAGNGSVRSLRERRYSTESRAEKTFPQCVALGNLFLSVNGARYNPNPIYASALAPPTRQQNDDRAGGRGPATTGDDVDGEVQRLEEDLQRHQSRIDAIQREMTRCWKARPTQRTATILPPQPSVLLANTDREVIELATLAYNFADSKRRKRVQNSAGGYFSPVFSGNTSISDAARSLKLMDNTDNEGSVLHSPSFTGLSTGSLSAYHITDSAMVLMEALANTRDVVLASPGKFDLARRGDVLSENHILIVDQRDTVRCRQGSTGTIAGAPCFRVVSKLNVAGVAQPTISAVRSITNELRRAFDGCIIWVNLREEPFIYINNEVYIVRESKEPLNPMIIPNVTGRSITQIEDKLKQEVLKEARENGGNISVHMEGRDGVMVDQWESADPDRVFTLREVFSGLQPTVVYHRRPITRNVGPQPQDFDFVVSTCLEDPRAMIVFNCQTGRGKTSSMMLIASIVRFYQFCKQDVSIDVRMLRTEGRGFNFRTIKKIVSLIPEGKLHERRVMALLELADKLYSITDHINAAFTSGSQSIEEDIMHLQQYAHFLVFSYYCEQRLWNFKIKAPFSEWLSENNELKLLIACIQSVEEEFKAERIAAPLTEGDEEWMSNLVRRRRGNVLSAGRILCCVQSESEEFLGRRPLWQLAPDVPIFTCGRLSDHGKALLMEEVRNSFPKLTRVYWLSLRAEPMVFINNVRYTLSDNDTVIGNPAELASTMHVSLQAIEQIEERLRRDVLLEANENNNTILVHRVDANNKRSAMSVKVFSVRAPKSIMAEFVASQGIIYHRVPLPFSGHMLPTDVDPLLECLSECKGENSVFIIADAEGPSRTIIALNILTLYRASRIRNLRLIKNVEDITEVLRVSHDGVVLPSAQVLSSIPVNPDEVPKGPVELRVAFTVCQMLTAGSLLHVVKAAISLGGCGRRWNILHLLDSLKTEGMNAAKNGKLIRDAARVARTYLLLLLSVIYIDFMGDYSKTMPFSDWVEERTEVANIIANIDQRAEEALKYMDFSNLKKADPQHRGGDVLTANFALKADHFPGCRKKGLRPELCGAPNFRKVDSVNVYGVAIPTLMGIRNILSLLGASHESLETYPGEQNDKDIYIGFAAPRLFDPLFRPDQLPKPLRGHVVWVNLREEPILYVGDRPFVLRNLDTPYVNVELTGIAAHKVEEVEMQLMTDVLREAEQHGDMILVNDEGEYSELVGIWESATPETVKTMRGVYNELAGKGFRVTLIRLPVTDEQSPSPKDFDALVAALLPRITMHMDRRETLSFVFNCQLGRGRTTTGMVICCLLIGLVLPEYYDGLNSKHNPLFKAEDSPLSRGEYSCIVQLKRVLTGGRLAKHHVDLVIEACSRMQNLRTAIESFALQAKSPDFTESQRGRAHHHGVHYLRRYFNLITFAAYLDEEYAPMKKQMQCTYASWLAQRPELLTLCESAVLR